MTEMIHRLYYMMEDWVGRHDLQGERPRELESQIETLQNEIVLRLGEGGQDMMETLAGLNLKLETIHDEALFRASMELGAKIARPRRGAWTAAVPGDAPTSGSGLTG